ncbi:PEP anchor domain-containing protein [Hapalosiphon sp. MRB220]|nr:PEP anchor domain-containing protein [Hapalosiphon sp. MRB220]
MVKFRHWLSVLTCSLAVSVTGYTTSAYGISLSDTLTIPGNSTDLYPYDGNSANQNRLGFFSDLYYDRTNDVYYGLSDRGPGGGVIAYETRVQKFSLDVHPVTGKIKKFKILETIVFKKDGQSFNGLNPELLNKDKAVLGQSFDPEGFAVAPNGNFYISDEYGPSVYEFSPKGEFIRSFVIPDNLIPKAGSTLNYVDGRPTITSGRQDNRGFEGLTITPDGKKLFAMLQDPLVNEGADNNGKNDGRYSRNLRLVEFDIASGQSTAQYIYQLESLTDINDRIPGTDNDFGQTAQGRNIGISAITALNNQEFLVLERDNRGFGVDALNALVDDPTDTPNPVASKRVYKISLVGATDVSNTSLAGTNTLPLGVNPVSKTLFFDVAQTLNPENPGDWTKIPEKMEGLTIGPKLKNGSYALLIGTDNDYSVTQNDDDVQFDVCSNKDGSSVSKITIDTDCPKRQSLVPGFLYSFKVNATELGNFDQAQNTPKSTTTAGLVLLGLAGVWLKRRHIK